MIDFHTHSNYSDGTTSPAELVRLAKAAGVRKLALTDHDTTAGLPEAAEEAQKQGVEFVPGIEISTYDNQHNSIHVVGLGLQNVAALAAVERQIRENRRERMLTILENIRQHEGLDIAFADLEKFCKGTIGNGNLEQYMVQQGLCADFKSAGAIINKYRSARYGIEIGTAFAAIHEAGGFAFLAHPCWLFLDAEQLAVKIARLKEVGLDGIEYAHSDHTPEQTALYLQLARQFELKLSAGSDFHGAFKPDIRLGVGRSGYQLGDESLINW